MEPEVGGRPGDWHRTQDEEYLRLVTDRLGGPPLRWVAQIVDMVAGEVGSGAPPVSVNDVGCNVGQLLKGFREVPGAPEVDYLGLDCSDTYLEVGRRWFPEATFGLLDVIVERPPRDAEVSVCSATLEHCDDWRAALGHILASTRRAAYVRTFLSDRHEADWYEKVGSEPYIIHAFTSEELTTVADAEDFELTLVDDEATGNEMRDLGCGISRAFRICVLRRRAGR